MTGYPILLDRKPTGRWVFILHGHVGRAYADLMAERTGRRWELGGRRRLPEDAEIMVGIDDDGLPVVGSIGECPEVAAAS